MPCPEELGGQQLTGLLGQTCLYARSTDWINTGADSTIIGIRHSPEGQAGRVLSCGIRAANDPGTDIAVTTGTDLYTSHHSNRPLTVWRIDGITMTHVHSTAQEFTQ